AAIIILAPIMAPIAARLGINPLHFGVVMVIGLNIGLITPPVGAVLFVTCSTARERLENIVREIWPFLLAQLASLVVIALSSDFALLVPRWLGLAR
ncbi:MAG: TRAP transporter large permease subunit, partial [Planctomycetes bacterium]|nr:TRAP transporter large permease subunit [Planctomycetota bacterium]